MAVPEGHQAKHKQDLKLYSLLMKGGDLELPPNGTAMTQGFHSFKTPVRIDSFQPHGHFRLVAKTLEIFYPDTGKLEMLSSVSNWTNNWHTSHIYDEASAPLVPKGAVLVVTGYYDNTTGNKGNPDPDQWVGLGSRTADEMSHAWIAVTHLDDETYAQAGEGTREPEEGHELHAIARAVARSAKAGLRRASRSREALSFRVAGGGSDRTKADRRAGGCGDHGRSQSGRTRAEAACAASS